MKTVRDVMSSNVIHLGPENIIKTAIILMKGHNIGGLPVLDGDKVVGVLDYHDILGKDNDIKVKHIMDREFVAIPPVMPINDAADLMSKVGSSRLLVTANGKLIGIVTMGDLIPELGRSMDPMTGLLRVDAMRDWGISALKSGQEITVLFLDLDNFGQFNKKYGHITGDKVLKNVAQVLQANVDEERELLCRYAGDEFVIVTTRNSEEAAALAQSLEDSIRSISDPEIPELVSGSIGVYGGKRTKEREHIHFEATLDNLINLASKACTEVKAQILQEPVQSTEQTNTEINPPPATATAPISESQRIDEDGRRLRIQGLNFSWNDNSIATAEIEIKNRGAVTKQSRSGIASGINALRLVAEATADAVKSFLPAPGYGVVTESVNIVSSGIGQDVVLVTALFVTPKAQTRVTGSALIKQDAYRAAAAALLNAINRQISPLI